MGEVALDSGVVGLVRVWLAWHIHFALVVVSALDDLGGAASPLMIVRCPRRLYVALDHGVSPGAVYVFCCRTHPTHSHSRHSSHLVSQIGCDAWCVSSEGSCMDFVLGRGLKCSVVVKPDVCLKQVTEQGTRFRRRMKSDLVRIHPRSAYSTLSGSALLEACCRNYPDRCCWPCCYKNYQGPYYLDSCA